MKALLYIKGESVTLDVDKAVKINYPAENEKNDIIVVTLKGGDRFALALTALQKTDSPLLDEKIIDCRACVRLFSCNFSPSMVK